MVADTHEGVARIGHSIPLQCGCEPFEISECVCAKRWQYSALLVLLIQWSMRKWRTMAKGVVGMVVVLSCGGRLGLCGVLQCQLTG